VALVTAVTAGVIFLALAGTVFAFQYAERGEIRHGVYAFGVDLSGLTRDEARAALLKASDQQGNQPLRLTDDWRHWQLSRTDLGLSMDIEGALDDAYAQGHHGWGPDRLALLWHLRARPQYVGQDRIGIVGAALDRQIADLAKQIDQPKIEPSLSFDADLGPAYTAPQIGRSLDTERTRSDVLSALASGERTVQLTIREDRPATTDADYLTAWQQLKNILDAPIEVVAADQTWTFTPQNLANWIMLNQPHGDQPASVTINQEWVHEVIGDFKLAVDHLPRSPRVWWDANGQLVKTKDGANGQQLREDDAYNWLVYVFQGNDATNRAEVPVDVQQLPPLPSDLNSLGISYELNEASTPYGASVAPRRHNIELAAQLLNGTLIMPGQTFSFDAEIGPMTIDAGFQVAYGIDSTGGNLTTIPSEAGGICQVATTVFQPIFWTGYQIDERNTHSYWIENYASHGYVGLDATVDETSGLDFRWTNNSSTAVLLEVQADGSDLTTRLYGTTPNWSVQVDPPVISDVKTAPSGTLYEPTDSLPSGDMLRIQHASNGFAVSVYRHVTQNGQVSDQQFYAEYGAVQDLVLVGSSP